MSSTFPASAWLILIRHSALCLAQATTALSVAHFALKRMAAMETTPVRRHKNDSLIGGVGTDVLIGYFGDDTYGIDSLTDVIGEATVNGGIDTVETTLQTYTLGVLLENLRHIDATAFRGVGNAAANRIEGNAGADTLAGLDGSDTLFGGAGNDFIGGGLGNDSSPAAWGSIPWAAATATTGMRSTTLPMWLWNSLARAWTLSTSLGSSTLLPPMSRMARSQIRPVRRFSGMRARM
ncbi:MAG: hypothetical protein HZT43_09940 [Exiguobacterium profundum]|nr:MAG: hypothetical protein HZT43_09940 [Exiguobacterium profundum]